MEARLIRTEHLKFLVEELGGRHLLNRNLLNSLHGLLEDVEKHSRNSVELSLTEKESEEISDGLTELFTVIGLRSGNETNEQGYYIEELIDLFRTEWRD
jgi:hypothetical protein